MTQVNMLEAKTSLSKLVRMIEEGQENVVFIARHGKPIVQMTLADPKVTSKRIGVAEGKFVCPKEFDAWDDEITDLFEDIV